MKEYGLQALEVHPETPGDAHYFVMSLNIWDRHQMEEICRVRDLWRASWLFDVFESILATTRFVAEVWCCRARDRIVQFNIYLQARSGRIRGRFTCHPWVGSSVDAVDCIPPRRSRAGHENGEGLDKWGEQVAAEWYT